MLEQRERLTRHHREKQGTRRKENKADSKDAYGKERQERSRNSEEYTAAGSPSCHVTESQSSSGGSSQPASDLSYYHFSRGTNASMFLHISF